MSRSAKPLLTLILLCLLLVTGCTSFEGEKVRKQHAEEFQQALAGKTEEALPAKGPVDLKDCIQIALKNNLSIKSAEIRQRIAKLERKVSFSSFLPTLTLNYDYVRWDPQPKIKFGGTALAMHDERIREITWQAQVSIFNPATWFIHSMHLRGEEIAGLATEYTRQMTVLQVTVLYFHCLSLEQSKNALQSQLAAARALEKELAAFQKEGFVNNWQVDQAHVMVQARSVEINKTSDALQQAKADLLTTMGLSPLADISLVNETPLQTPGQSLEDLILQALLLHPSLHIEDRRVAIEQEKVKIAITDFLPRLIGFAGRVHTSDSFQKYPNYWMTGLTGTLTIFNGFANVNEYRAAKEQRQDAFVRREQASLALMLQVVRAYLSRKNAAEEMALAENYLIVATEHLRQVRQQWQEGLVNSSELLQVTAERDQAQIHVMNTRFQHQVTVATVLNVIGKTGTQFEEQGDEG